MLGALYKVYSLDRRLHVIAADLNAIKDYSASEWNDLECYVHEIDFVLFTIPRTS